MARFAELLGRSCFSFLEGASHPAELVERSRELALDAIALCDRDGLYGSVRMHAAATEMGQKVIVGAELTLEPSTAEPVAIRSESLAAPRPPGAPPRQRRSVALLAETHDGYAALCRLLTAAHADHDKGEAGIDVETIAADADGLFALLPLDPSCPPSGAQLETLREALGERCAIAAWRHLEPDDEPRLQLARQVAARYDLPIVASARPLYHHRRRKPLADVVHCIRHKTTLDDAGTALGRNAEAELKDGARMLRLFSTEPGWVARSLDIAERCSFSLGQLSYRFPSEHGTGCVSPDEILGRQVAQGARLRYPDGVPVGVQQQLDKELALIAQLGMAPYFSSVQEIVEMARARGILCQGRGSAANSAVCFVLGITAVDPARSALLFERFMSAERDEPPDIDVDFEHERREEVIQAIYQRYGRDRAAMVSEVIAYRPKSALREVGKVFGLSADQLDRLSSVVSHYGWREDGDARTPEAVGDISPRSLRSRGLDPGDVRLQQVLGLAHELEGVPRHLSIHVGGFVLSAEPLYRIAPIEPARMPDRTVIPWDKDDMEALGFFKVDVLGLGMLTAIRKALGLVHARQQRRPRSTAGQADAPARWLNSSAGPFDPIAALATIPPEDPAVYDGICRADTVGVFQIESRAQMAMLPLLKPRRFYDLVVEVGIVRPGPIQGKMVHPYLRRRTGEEPVSYPHGSLAPILERTLGVPLFQEQVMQIAITGAGYSGGEADQLRRDMAAWRKHGRLERHRDKLLGGFDANGVPREFGERLFQQIMGFGEYGFPESHAASFALLVYASAWLKVHHPAAFVCALLNSQPMGFYSPGSLVRDAQRDRPTHRGIEVRPVRIEHSDWDCALEPQGDGEPALRLGFRLVRGLARGSVDELAEVREQRRASRHGDEGQPLYESIDDFVAATRLRRGELELLAEAGALEGLTPLRREAMWRIRAPRAEGLFADQSIEPAGEVGLAPLEPAEQLALDYGTVGLSVSDHPMRHLRKKLARRRVRRAEEQSQLHQGQQVTMAGVVQSRQRPMTAKGIVFITLEDETGLVNLVIYPKIYEAHELVARHATILLARGRVDRRGEVVHIRVNRLERLDTPRGQPLRLRSRDFH